VHLAVKRTGNRAPGLDSLGISFLKHSSDHVGLNRKIAAHLNYWIN